MRAIREGSEFHLTKLSETSIDREIAAVKVFAVGWER
jgi:hypothetical protein